MKNAKILLFFLLSILINGWFTASLFAATPHIQDYAKVLTPEMTQKLEALLVEMESKKGVHVEQIIMADFANRPPAAVANALFKQLAVNAPTVDKRVLLLIVLSNNSISILTTNSLKDVLDINAIGDIQKNTMSKLSLKQYDEAARTSIAGVYYFYDKKYPASTGDKKSKNPMLNIFLFAIAIIVVIGIAKLSPKK